MIESLVTFGYDNPRQRYMSRDYDVSGGPDPGNWTPMAIAQWTDYNGAMPYLDFDLDNDGSNNAIDVERTRYLAGRGVAARQDVGTAADEFLHGDLIRSTVMTTDAGGTVAATVSYTAFGELTTSAGVGGDLPPGFPRHAYAGGWGYETGLLTLSGAPNTDPIILQHLGARWYQPDTARFIMRDPIGIDGGLNVYVYVTNMSLDHVDPTGLDDVDQVIWNLRHTVAKNSNDFRRRAARFVLHILPTGIEVGVGVNGVATVGLGADVNGNWYLYCSVGIPGLPGASATGSIGNQGPQGSVGGSLGGVGAGTGGKSVTIRVGPFEVGGTFEP